MVFCKFTIVDIGAESRRSDDGIFENSLMGELFSSDCMSLPPPSKIGARGPITPYFLVGDEAIFSQNS